MTADSATAGKVCQIDCVSSRAHDKTFLALARTFKVYSNLLLKVGHSSPMLRPMISMIIATERPQRTFVSLRVPFESSDT